MNPLAPLMRRRHNRHGRRVALGLAALLGAAAVATSGAADAAPAPASAPRPAAVQAPTVQTLISGLTIPWDLTFFPNGDMLFTERSGVLHMRTAAGATWTVRATNTDLWPVGESGLMGIVVDPTSVHTYFYTCQSYQSAGRAVDIRVIQWRLSGDGRSATRSRVVLTGLPITSGRHSGCRMRFTPGYRLNVGTGDAATGTNPQNLSSGGGKVLRVDPRGTVPSDNPYATSTGIKRFVWSYGHRNVQGLAVRPGSNQLWSQEQGTYRDDESNLIQRGGNYGYDPVPGYNETVPMTDTTKFPNAIVAKWSSGPTTVATSGSTFLQGARWGRWNGALAIAELKGQGVRVLTLDAAGNVKRVEQIPVLDNTYGRIRTVQSGPGGALYLTTSNGTRADKVLRLAPYAP